MAKFTQKSALQKGGDCSNRQQETGRFTEHKTKLQICYCAGKTLGKLAGNRPSEVRTNLHADRENDPHIGA